MLYLGLFSINLKKLKYSLDKLMKGYNLLVIAYILSSMIYFFEEGKIVEKGKFDNLINSKKYFWNLTDGIRFHSILFNFFIKKN